ncbi:methionine--tRNA ligase [Helicobacter baculiformis]|uniref:Methionine--tRNA ligase n=1 Tax=Helicobacter baculiformis TaxID=427351 RepID=A0ABV7ZIM8_9HELI|nr:methionine--tRNA ligase [Helicobacter baculiformis]
MQRLVSTPIYYVNDVPHLGHAYTTFIADMLKRYYTLRGHEVFFLTGTDEHGQKIALSAQKHGLSPLEYASQISAHFRSQWDFFDIGYDHFIRTTDSAHVLAVQRAFATMLEQGDIYKGTYRGSYCVSCESFVANHARCPDCQRETSILEEESYFFRLSQYQEPLLEFYAKNPRAILPTSRAPEVLRFIEQGLHDLSITRTSFEWGIKLPPTCKDPKHVIYVWLDALLNYVSALGYPHGEKMGYFNHAIHVVGKDILRFHAIYWPAFLMSLGLPLFKHLCVHGWWTIEGVKMSKSIGNVINAQEVAQNYGKDPLRYFLLREVPLGQDGDFSLEALLRRSNADLSNTLGNLLQRLSGMAWRYFEGRIESAQVLQHYAQDYATLSALFEPLEASMQEMQPHKYLEDLWKVFEGANALIARDEPWKMRDQAKIMALLGLVAALLAKATYYLYPVIPQSARKLADILGLKLEAEAFGRIQENPFLDAFVIAKTPPLFPRLELIQAPKPKTQTISLKDFQKLEIRVGQVVSVEKLEQSDKLLLLRVDFGDRVRVILSGIAKHYAPKTLEGQQVCALVNLEPRKMLGVLSEGMVLSAGDGEHLSLIAPLTPMKNGSAIS